jgi:hypothetical protein
MPGLIDQTFTNLLNGLRFAAKPRLEGGLWLGNIVQDNRISDQPYYLPTTRRPEHIAIQGKTGSGKSYFLRHLAQHDIDAGHGFLLFDIHGDLIPSLLAYAASAKVDPERLILIDPVRTDWVIGLNPLEAADEHHRFLQIAEITRSLSTRWDFTGARTEELLRNALHVLSENGLTLLEVGPLLANDSYRAHLLKQVKNEEVREYFELRFNPLSDAMKAAMREPVLNKLTELTADPHFRFLLGQRDSTISFDNALNFGAIVLVNINKGALGTHALTFGALVYAKLKAAIFRKKTKKLFTIYADELQSLLSEDTDFDVLFSESRKFSVSLVTANQFSNQLPAKMRSAMQAIGTRIFFRLSSEDAEQAAKELGGGKGMAEQLRNLPQRHFIVHQGNFKSYEVVAPEIRPASISAHSLVEASLKFHAKRRSEVESDIAARRPKQQPKEEVLNEWD